jgi:endoglucanase
MAEEEVFGNNVIVNFEPVACPGQAVTDFDTCVCNGQLETDETPAGFTSAAVDESSTTVPASIPTSTSAPTTASDSASTSISSPTTSMVAPSATTTVSSCAAEQTLYGQCGGENWAGPTLCSAPATCVVSNPYYFQCLHE